MKVDILAIGVHPDDVELSCAGTLLAQQAQGYKTAILDLTCGELGTRGTAELRLEEAEAAAKILQVSARENLQMADGFFENNAINQLKIIEKIRFYQPDIVLANALTDRHPDHGRAAQLVYDALFLSGLRKIETQTNNEMQLPWRPRLLLNYIQDRYIQPDIVVDVSAFMQQKMDAIAAYGSQFHNPESTEPSTYISSPTFWEGIKARGNEMGRPCQFDYAEGFTSAKILGTKNLFDVF